MAAREPVELIKLKTTYTFNEAIEFMKMKDKQATNEVVNWTDVKTGNRVYIGYT